ncbi:MAG: type II secretion system protein M [Gammaproteobacteria bacterium]|nr:type II secretion system protein M [Gammaproteobacteria bacterium]MBU2224327.1 type II secretion system protein M [Gammaproteobacteria bacterium]MBU2277617.1 type II secretion system protein M [Gammaproteobacteria bacterium]
MKQLKLWWASLQPREQRLVGIGGVVLIIGAFYWLLWQPLHQSRTTQQQAATSAQAQLIWLQSQLPKLSQQSNSVRSSASLTEVVSQTSRNFQVQVSRMQPQNEQLQLSLEDLAFDQLLRWLHELQFQHGIRLVQLDIATADKPGQVRVRRMLIE